mmetsp:Transcript_7508/g.13160  ORF Transcript_7508/g.13160 Transcript_7508/m.13160 type:complete len:179 (-) Transcript_7508:435-971(-)
MMFQEPSAAFRTPTSSFVSSSDPTSPPPAPKPKRYRVSKVGRRHVDTALSVCPELMMPLLNETVLLSRVPSFRLKRRSSAQAVAAAGGRRSQQVSPEPSPSRLQSVSNDQQYCPGQQQQQGRDIPFLDMIWDMEEDSEAASECLPKITLKPSDIMTPRACPRKRSLSSSMVFQVPGRN